jgi:hypothetical protein
METYKRCWKWPPFSDLYLISEWGRFYVGHPIELNVRPTTRRTCDNAIRSRHECQHASSLGAVCSTLQSGCQLLLGSFVFCWLVSVLNVSILSASQLVKQINS